MAAPLIHIMFNAQAKDATDVKSYRIEAEGADLDIIKEVRSRQS